MISMIYAGGAYAVFLLTFLYAIGFTGEIVVPKSINSGDAVPLTEALAVNTVLLATFAIQHSLMARPFFKRWWTQLVPQTIERSTYVLFASAALILLFWQWRPLPHVVWELRSPIASPTLQVVFWLGWGLVLVSTFLISHFELFGLRQAVMAWLDRTVSFCGVDHLVRGFGGVLLELGHTSLLRVAKGGAHAERAEGFRSICGGI